MVFFFFFYKTDRLANVTYARSSYFLWMMKDCFDCVIEIISVMSTFQPNHPIFKEI
jgi:hypothetical protein